MPKSTVNYWNPLIAASKGKWQPVKGLEGMAEELTLSIDEATAKEEKKVLESYILSHS